jgi:hypothetical protein
MPYQPKNTLEISIREEKSIVVCLYTGGKQSLVSSLTRLECNGLLVLVLALVLVLVHARVRTSLDT